MTTTDNTGLGRRGGLAVLCLVIGEIAATSVYRSPASRRAECIEHLRMIEGAKEQWALERSAPVGSPSDRTAIDGYFKVKAPLTCPAGGIYTYNPVGTDPTCSRGPTQGHTL
jgi:hypothetical protein